MTHTLKDLLNIKPGEIVTYWTAAPRHNLPIDGNTRDDSPEVQARANECATLAATAMKLYREGRVELVQRRTPTDKDYGTTEYLAIGRHEIVPPGEL